MKQYFILNHVGNIIMLDVRNIKKCEDIICIDNDSDSDDYKLQHNFYTIEFGNFLGVIKLRKRKVNPETGMTVMNSSKTKNYVIKTMWRYEPNPEGGFICFDTWGEEEKETYREKSMEIIYNEKNKDKYFIEFEDDEAAKLWIETMRDEYSVRGDE